MARVSLAAAALCLALLPAFALGLAGGAAGDRGPAPASVGAPQFRIKRESHKMASFDGVELHLEATFPVGLDPAARQPIVVFCASWATPIYEYIWPAEQWAKAGIYTVLYTARGWYASGGLIDTAGPKDLKDGSAIVDWALKQWPQANVSKVGFAGISYGGGIAALMAATDPRVNCVVMMSGWASIVNSLYWHESPNKFWGGLLVDSGSIPGIGREDPELKVLWHDLLSHNNVSYVTQWANLRSPDQYMAALNAKKGLNMFVNSNFGDNLFHSQRTFAFWQNFTGPKRIDFSQGTHATAELSGLIGVPSKIWDNAKAWVDYYLLDIANGVPSEPKVSFEVENHQLKPQEHVTFPDWPPAGAGWREVSLTLGKRTAAYGTLTPPSWASRSARAAGNNSDTIAFMEHDDVMSTGFPGVSDALEPYVPILADLKKTRPQTSIVYLSATYPDGMRICGVPRLEGLTLVAGQGSFQLVTYLYSVNPTTTEGHLISHVPLTDWNSTAGVPETRRPLEMHTTCFDVPKGHMLGLGFDMYDVLYEPANSSTAATVEVLYGGANTTASSFAEARPTLVIPLAG